MEHISRLHIRGGFAYGWARSAAGERAEVHLWMDGHHIATEFTGRPLPSFCTGDCGKAPAPDAGFMFALPASALDGFPRDLHASVPGTDGESVHSEVQTYQHSAVRGEVQQHGRQFVGTVWFDRRQRGGRLHVTTTHGKVLLGHPLSVSTNREMHGYPARFAVPCEGLPSGPLHFTCRGQALRGSPLSRRVAVLGILEQVDAGGIRGWAFDSADLGRPIELCLRVDGRAMAWFRPNTRRPEIEARLGQRDNQIGLLGFHVALPDGVADGRQHRIEVVCADDGQLLQQGQHLLRADPAWVPHEHTRASPVETAPAARHPKRERPHVSLIVLNRNGEAVLSSFLESWSRHNTVPAEIIVIDHASTDGSVALLKSWEKRLDLKVLALDRNDSFSASSNLGARHARGDALLFMNNDIVWLQDSLPAMMHTLHQADVGIVGLKLLKAVGESAHALAPATEVQHLGVRFKAHERGYWPYEATTTALRRESEYAQQVVPAVTGAALLCRKADFEAAGGFHTDYFYGFEDVELCLRLSQRLRKLVVSRNDLCALHRHGHTRLSGREITLFDRVQRNPQVLESHIGLWAKQAYWRSLVRGDGYMTTEALTIGIVVDGAPLAKAHSTLKADALGLADDLQLRLPRARVVFLPPERDWKNADGLHVLVVGTPEYDVRSVHHARADLLTLAWVRPSTSAWETLPWWNQFGGYVPVPSAHRQQSGRSTGRARELPSETVECLLTPRSWRLRVAVQIPLTSSTIPVETSVVQRAKRLVLALKRSGLPCWLVPLEQWDTHTMMADACITLQGAAPAPAWTPRSDVLNVLWLCEPGAKRPGGWHARHGRVTREEPTRGFLEQAMEESVGSTFRPS